MKIPKSETTKHLKRLLRIAHRSRVQIHFLSSSLCEGWDGLYVTTPELGAGIAIRDDLPPDERDWILAHELGHHFSRLNLRLFSPFAAHLTDPGRRRPAGEWIKLDPDEVRANSWAIDALVTQDEWEHAERGNPCDLRGAMKHLGLPVAAGIAWSRRQRAALKSSQQISIKFSPDEWSTLSRSVTGEGGHQSFFRRVLNGPKP